MQRWRRDPLLEEGMWVRAFKDTIRHWGRSALTTLVLAGLAYVVAPNFLPNEPTPLDRGINFGLTVGSVFAGLLMFIATFTLRRQRNEARNATRKRDETIAELEAQRIERLRAEYAETADRFLLILLLSPFRGFRKELSHGGTLTGPWYWWSGIQIAIVNRCNYPVRLLFKLVGSAGTVEIGNRDWIQVKRNYSTYRENQDLLDNPLPIAADKTVSGELPFLMRCGDEEEYKPFDDEPLLHIEDIQTGNSRVFHLGGSYEWEDTKS